MKIGIICHDSCGGSSRIAIDKALELSRKGHYVYLFTRSPAYMLPGDTKTITCRSIYNAVNTTVSPARLKTSWPVAEQETMSDIIASSAAGHGMDILHVHYALPFIFIARKVKEKLQENAPAVILTLHGTDVTRLAEICPDPDRLADILSFCDRVTTVSASHASLFTRMSGLNMRLEIIPDFTDLSRFLPKPPQISGDPPTLLHISNFREIKNPSAVIEIFFQLRKKRAAHLWLVGDGDEMNNVKKLAEKKGVSQYIRFWGMQPDVSTLIRKADMLVMTSVYESFCLVALECMACGVPVLAPRIGGIPEVVRHGETGFLFPPGSYRDAVDFSVKLFSDPEQYARISRKCVQRAQVFDLKKMVALYENLYSRVLEENTGLKRNAADK